MAKKAAKASATAAASATRGAPVPLPSSAPSPEPVIERPPSYLEGVPRDHAELVSGLLQVVRGAAKDLKTLITQAIAMSNQKNDRFDR